MSPSNGLQLQKGGGGGVNGQNYIEHRVSKFDTLAGVAIKYGVEVADIKRMNALATDLQMFALKTLKIPLPGRHTPSARLGDDGTQSRISHIDQFGMKEPFPSLRLKASQQKISPAMSTLQKHYGLKSSNLENTYEGTETVIYTSATSDHSRDEWLPKASSISDLPSSHYPGSRNLAYDLLTENDAASKHAHLAGNRDGEGEKSDDRSVRRRSKAEVDSGAATPERLLKEENIGGFSGSSTGKGLGMRPKSASRAVLLPESESECLDSIPVGLGESILTNGLSGVRKSASTSSLREQEKNNSAAIWPTARWSLKPDLQAFSTAAITKPIFDGLPIPITGRWGKAALD